ncbi:hypothetical protein JA1_000701 [Spathaspora sp. JA1]|nr:hypothetical protein JA1_000701 [Spathaspora sp. JA1]
MRSFIKSHRKTESSDLIEHLEYVQPLQPVINRNNSFTTSTTTTNTTPIPSPQVLQYTPPPVSSPKKLLTPIKNLFSSHHHSKSLTNTPTSENLQNVINGYSPSKHRFIKKQKPKQTPPDELDLEQPQFTPSFRKVTSSPSLHVFYPANTRPPPRIIKSSQNRIPHYDGISITGPKQELGPPITLTENGSSDTSMTESHENFQTKTVVFDESVHDDSERTYSDDEYDDDDSSQFSFVQDMKGGRNTSIKYYKDKTTTPAVNTFDENDLGYEVDEYSDYDFENNGLEDEEGMDEDVQYNRAFEEPEEVNYSHSSSTGYSSEVVPIFEPKNESITPIPMFTPSSLDNLKEDTRVFNESYHLSIQGPIELESPTIHEPPSQEDLLENYLDYREEEPGTRTPEETENYELFDLHSPMINGLTVGYRILPANKTNKNRLFIHRNPIQVNSSSSCDLRITKRYWHSFHESLDENLHLQIDEKVECFTKSTDLNKQVGLGIISPDNEVKQPRASILGMMDILSSLENKPEPVSKRHSIGESIEHSKEDTIVEKRQTKRQSIVDMMSTLSNIESSRRDSINDMMTTLAKIEPSHRRDSINEMMNTLSKIEDSTKRRDSINDMMTTLANLDLLNTTPFTKEINKSIEQQPKRPEPVASSTTPIINQYLTDKDTSMDQDLIDEINQLPLDFEFDQQSKPDKSLFTSNSYNKKPTKAIISNQYQSNKIETSNKTVTFYNNNYSAPSLDRTSSISRTGSYNSCTSVKEENWEEEDEQEEPESTFRQLQKGNIHF